MRDQGALPGVRYVVFDMGGVLLELGEAGYRQSVARHLRLEEVPPSYVDYTDALYRGEISEQALWAKLIGRPLGEAEVEACIERFIAHFPPIEPMLEFARELRRLGIGTAILSNTQDVHLRAVRRMGVLDGFDPTFFSCEIGLRKPSAAAYRHVIGTLGLAPDQIAFIDDLAENVEAARAAGLHGILHAGDVEATRRAVLELVVGSDPAAPRA